MSGVCPVQNILLGSSVKTRDSCVLSSKQGVNTLLKLELLLFFIYANFAPMTAYQDDNFQWVAPNYPRRPLSLPKYALALARRLIRETTQSILVKSNPLAVSLSFICFPWLKFDKLAECPTSVIFWRCFDDRETEWTYLWPFTGPKKEKKKKKKKRQRRNPSCKRIKKNKSA